MTGLHPMRLRSSPSQAPRRGRLRSNTSRRTGRRTFGRFDSLEDRRLLTINYTAAFGFGATTGNVIVPQSATVDSAGNTIVVGTFQGTVNFNPAGNPAS